MWDRGWLSLMFLVGALIWVNGFLSESLVQAFFGGAVVGFTGYRLWWLFRGQQRRQQHQQERREELLALFSRQELERTERRIGEDARRRTGI